ncbi:11041_t:CDS:2, partial [Funneliformis geosporum]
GIEVFQEVMNKREIMIILPITAGVEVTQEVMSEKVTVFFDYNRGRSHHEEIKQYNRNRKYKRSYHYQYPSYDLSFENTDSANSLLFENPSSNKYNK